MSKQRSPIYKTLESVHDPKRAWHELLRTRHLPKELRPGPHRLFQLTTEDSICVSQAPQTMANVLAIAEHPRAFLHAERLAFLVARNLVSLTAWAIRHNLLVPAAAPAGFTGKSRAPAAILWQNKAPHLHRHLQAQREARVTWPFAHLQGWRAVTEILTLARYRGLQHISEKKWPYDLLDLLSEAARFWNDDAAQITVPGRPAEKPFPLRRLRNPFVPLYELMNTHRHGFVEVVPCVTANPQLLVTVGFQLL